MRRRTPLNAAFGNPTVIGALAVLITILAVFLAYNANNGLPFVQSYRLTAEVPNAAALVPGNEVRIGGVRVGIVESIDPVAAEDGSYAAQLSLKLDKSVDPLPVDSTVIIRARSALGLKYVQIVRGTSDQGYAAGSVLPLSAARPEPVEFDEFLSTFDKPTQRNDPREPEGVRQCARRPRPGPQRGDRRPEAAAAAARAGDADDLRSADRDRPVLHRARAVGGGGRSGRADAGADVRRPRHHDRRVRRRRPPVPAGDDLEDAR